MSATLGANNAGAFLGAKAFTGLVEEVAQDPVLNGLDRPIGKRVKNTTTGDTWIKWGAGDNDWMLVRPAYASSLAEEGRARMREMGATNWSENFEECMTDAGFFSVSAANGGSNNESPDYSGGVLTAATSANANGVVDVAPGRFLDNPDADTWWIGFYNRFTFATLVSPAYLYVGVSTGANGRIVVGAIAGTSLTNFVIWQENDGGADTFTGLVGIPVATATWYRIRIWNNGTNAFVAINDNAVVTVLGGAGFTVRGNTTYAANNNGSDAVDRQVNMDLIVAMAERES